MILLLSGGIILSASCSISDNYKANLEFNKGVLAYQNGNTGEATNFFKQALNYNPDHVRTNYNLGTIYLNQGEYQLALEHLNKAFIYSTTDSPLIYDIEDKFSYITLDDMIKVITSLKVQYSEFKNLTIKTHRYYEDFEMQLVGFRPENDEEYKKRIKIYERNKAAVERRKSRQIEKEKDNLAKLLQKHGIPKNWKK